MRLLAFRSREISRPYFPTKCVRKSSFAAMFEYSPKNQDGKKLLVFEMKNFAKLHFTGAQPRLVLNL